MSLKVELFMGTKMGMVFFDLLVCKVAQERTEMFALDSLEFVETIRMISDYR
jgi:hypothetical protein